MYLCADCNLTDMNTQAYSKVILVTGGAGFIGSNLLRRLVPRYPNYLFVNIDALTYAGNLSNLSEIETAPNYLFYNIDVTDSGAIGELFDELPISHVIHLAAESHVDRSIKDPLAFVRTNIFGTVTLLNAALKAWQGEFENKLFYHISTDEVYGNLAPGEEPFTETTPYSPRSPYSASKASSDHFVRAYHETYGLPTIVSNCSNNYGPYQFPEKLIPLCILNILKRKPLPIYGDGMQVRDWLYVDDHVDAIDAILHRGVPGETYNIGGHNEMRNIDLVKMLISLVDKEIGNPEGYSLDLITYVPDRLGHDTRYAIDPTKLRTEIELEPAHTISDGLLKTVKWYLSNRLWLETIASGEYRHYYEETYGRHSK